MINFLASLFQCCTRCVAFFTDNVVYASVRANAVTVPVSIVAAIIVASAAFAVAVVAVGAKAVEVVGDVVPVTFHHNLHKLQQKQGLGQQI